MRSGRVGSEVERSVNAPGRNILLPHQVPILSSGVITFSLFIPRFLAKIILQKSIISKAIWMDMDGAFGATGFYHIVF